MRIRGKTRNVYNGKRFDSHPTVIRKYLRYRKKDIYKCNYDFIIAFIYGIAEGIYSMLECFVVV